MEANTMTGLSVEDELKQLNLLYNQANQRAEKLYDFVLRYNKYMATPKDYGTGQLVGMADVHLLTYIEEHPGITSTELATVKNISKSAISQTVKRLVTDGYVRRAKMPGNSKAILLYPTDSGSILANAHKRYDLMDIAGTLEALLRHCTTEEVDTFYKVIDVYRRLFDEEG